MLAFRPPVRLADWTCDDAELMARIQHGDRAAFAALVQRHAERFYRLAYRQVGHKAEAEDIVQEAFLKLWGKPPASWDKERNTAFTTWFYRVVINLCIDHQRKKRPLPLPEGLDMRDDGISQEENLMLVQRRRQLEAQMKMLPPRQQAALNLCFYEGLSNQEAAAVMGLRLKALQSLLMRAKVALREALKEV
ncbi:MAG: sigma-70 family RNA polymerase sigma factor [Alphaproteobacteria bacterium]|nr:sigma-70 family RNA polymerase sigma factor [Alphaproteobacteria bacterium]